MSAGYRSRQRHFSFPHGGYATSSPLFYTIPWNPSDYSVSALGPGQSSRIRDPMFCRCLEADADIDTKQLRPCIKHSDHECLDYSKSGFTYFHKSQKCVCGFLSEYRKQYNRRAFASARQNPSKPWWSGRELTSKFDPRFPCYPMHNEGLSTYAKDFRGTTGEAANLCFPEGEIERARNILPKRRWDTSYRGLDHSPLFASTFYCCC